MSACQAPHPRSFRSLAFVVCMAMAAPASAARDTEDTFTLCDAETEDLSSRGAFEAAAARGLECWTVTKNPLFLFRAAKYWKSAGFHAHAVAAFRRYQENSTMDKAERARSVPAALSEELARTGNVSLQFKPELRPGEVFTLMATFRGGDRQPLEFRVTDSTFAVDLDPGQWLLQFSRTGLLPNKSTIDVALDRTPQARPLTSVELPREAPPTPPTPLQEPPSVQKPWKGLAIGGGLASGGGLTALAVAVGFAASVNRTQATFNNVCMTQRDDQCESWRDRGLTANRAQIAGLVVGPILLSAGVTMLVIAIRRKAAAHKHGLAPTIGPRQVGLVWQHRF